MLRYLIPVFLLLIPSVQSDDWPSFRGPLRNGRQTETGLLKSWPEGGPAKVWTSREAGLGYSGFSVVGDQLFTMGADGDTEYLIALSAKDGSLLWRTAVGTRLKNGWGDGPRSTPTVTGDLVIALGGNGGVVCASTSDGSQVWSADLTKIGGKVPTWGYSESPLVDGNLVLCTPGGPQGTVVAYDLPTGRKVWQSEAVTEGAHYSSIVPVTHFGNRQYIQLTQNKLFGLDKDGALQWSADWPRGRTAVIPTPIYHEGCVYMTSGYSAGCMAVRISEDNQVEQLYDNKVMQNHHGGVIRVGNHVYGHAGSRGWICQELLTGEMVWNEKRSLDKGAIAYADGQFYCLEKDSGTCVLIDASPEGWKEHGRFVIEPQTEQRNPKGRIWVHPVIANGRLYLRDQEIVCSYDIRSAE